MNKFVGGLGILTVIYLVPPMIFFVSLGAEAILCLAATGELPPPPPRPARFLRKLPIWRSIDEDIQGMEKSYPAYRETLQKSR